MYYATRPCKYSGSTLIGTESPAPQQQNSYRRGLGSTPPVFRGYAPVSVSAESNYKTRLRRKRGVESVFATSFRNRYLLALRYPIVREQWLSHMEETRRLSRDSSPWSLNPLPASNTATSLPNSSSKKNFKLFNHDRSSSPLDCSNLSAGLELFDESQLSQNRGIHHNSETPRESTKETNLSAVWNRLTSVVEVARNVFTNSTNFDDGSSPSFPSPASSNSSFASSSRNKLPKITQASLKPSATTSSELLRTVVRPDSLDNDMDSFVYDSLPGYAQYSSTPIKRSPSNSDHFMPINNEYIDLSPSRSNSDTLPSITHSCSRSRSRSRSRSPLQLSSCDSNSDYGSSLKFKSKKKNFRSSTPLMDTEFKTKSNSSSPVKQTMTKSKSRLFADKLANKVSDRLKNKYTGSTTASTIILPESPYPPVKATYATVREIGQRTGHSYPKSGSKKGHRRANTKDISIDQYRELLSQREQEIVEVISVSSSPKIPYPSSSSITNEERLVAQASRQSHHKYDELTAKRKELQKAIEELRLDDQKQKEKEVKAKKRDEVIRALESAHLNKVLQIWRCSPSTATLAEVNRVAINSRDLQTLRDGQWLNDGVINFYLGLITQRSQDNNSLPLSFSFNTFFFSNLSTKGYSSVARWASRKKINVTKLDYLFVPINRHQTHWCFVMVDLIQKNFVFYDSMSTKQTRTGLEILEMVKQYMVQESQSQDPSQNWKEFYDAYESIGGDECPQQENGFDCGVFVCKAVEVKSRGLDFNYTQKDMINLRRRMVYEMLQCKLLT